MPLPENPPTGRLPFVPPPTFPADMEEYWNLWRQEKFWACHEALEEVWKAESNPLRKQFLQGLIHGAVAIFQFRRGNFVGAARQFTRASIRLKPSLPEQEGLDVTGFLAGVEEEIKPAFERLNEKHLTDLSLLAEQLSNRLYG